MLPLDPLINLISIIRATPNCGFTDSLVVKEPINAISNLFYFIAGFQLYKEYYHHHLEQPYIRILIFLSFTMGAASTIHHSIPTNLTLFIDGLPIYLIFALIIFLFVQLIFSLSLRKSICISLCFLLLLAFVSPYLPIATIPVLKFYFVQSAIFIVLIGVSFLKTRQKSWWLIGSLTSFWAGLGFFYLDPVVCPYFSLGSHFIWHFFTSLSLYFVTKYFLEYSKEFIPRSSKSIRFFFSKLFTT